MPSHMLTGGARILPAGVQIDVSETDTDELGARLDAREH
jgi:hypothetical protein